MFYDYFETGLIGTLTLVADEKGLRHVVFESGRRPLTIRPDWRREPAALGEARAQLASYFRGERREFALPLAPEGTAFQKQVWQVLRTIPYGEVASYSWVAAKLGRPKAVRAVGGANGRNPLPIVVPCHRVIGSDGGLTGFGGGLEVKRLLLELEKKYMGAQVRPVPPAEAGSRVLQDRLKQMKSC